jgi:hypothetical protein
MISLHGSVQFALPLLLMTTVGPSYEIFGRMQSRPSASITVVKY